MAAKEERGMTQPPTMFTTPWCGYCRRLKNQLAREGIEIIEVDIEREPTAAEYVETVNGGYQTVPTVLFSDGSTLTNPSVRAVMRRMAELAVLEATI
jgi:mycoredoxin